MCGRLIIIQKKIYINNYHWHLIQIINDSNVSDSVDLMILKLIL